MLSFDCFVMCKNISRENKADTKYEYMYTYKYPEEEAPKGGIACFAKTLKKEKFGYNLDVTIIGTNNSNPYFDVSLSSGDESLTRIISIFIYVCCKIESIHLSKVSSTLYIGTITDTNSFTSTNSLNMFFFLEIN